MAQKIHQLQLSKTDVQEAKEWAEVLSHRNKLLMNSDWTQLPDAGLTEECVQNWRNWRAIARQLRRSNHPDIHLVAEQIARLTRAMPFNVYLEETVEALPLYESDSE